jgi:hypothetical protein
MLCLGIIQNSAQRHKNYTIKDIDGRSAGKESTDPL